MYLANGTSSELRLLGTIGVEGILVMLSFPPLFIYEKTMDL